MAMHDANGQAIPQSLIPEGSNTTTPNVANCITRAQKDALDADRNREYLEKKAKDDAEQIGRRAQAGYVAPKE
jgi:hypothetical protein